MPPAGEAGRHLYHIAERTHHEKRDRDCRQNFTSQTAEFFQYEFGDGPGNIDSQQPADIDLRRISPDGQQSLASFIGNKRSVLGYLDPMNGISPQNAEQKTRKYEINC